MCVSVLATLSVSAISVHSPGVGAVVGRLVGDEVGAVGLTVGSCDGALLGRPLGLADGVTEGRSLGVPVGLSDGAVVGGLLGASDGAGEGLLVLGGTTTVSAIKGRRSASVLTSDEFM